MSSSTDETAAFINAFRHGLRELGYVEGERGGAKPDRVSDLSAELVRPKADIIVVGGSLAVHTAKEATSTIPIVMRYGSEPVKAGLIVSLASEITNH